MTWKVNAMWVPSPPPGKSYHGEGGGGGGKLVDTFRLRASALHFKHLLVAGGRVLDFDSATLLLLLVTSLFLLIFLLRRSAAQKNRHLLKQVHGMHPNMPTGSHSITAASSRRSVSSPRLSPFPASLRLTERFGDCRLFAFGGFLLKVRIVRVIAAD